MTEKYGPPENRQKVIQQLADLGTPEALSVLCLRFTIRADPGITDDEEKEHVRQILVDAGDKAVEPVKQFLERHESGISWGLRVLAELRAGRRRGGDRARGSCTGSGASTPATRRRSWCSSRGWPSTTATSRRSRRARAARRRSTTRSSRSWRTSPTTSASRRVRLLARQPLEREDARGAHRAVLRDKDNARVRGEVLQALADLGAHVKGYRPSVEALLVEPLSSTRKGT